MNVAVVYITTTNIKWQTHLCKFSRSINMTQLFQKLITETIDNNFKGDAKELLKSILYSLVSPSEYFATRVKDAIKSFGTKDHLLMRIIISRDEIDMPQIKQYYKQLYGKDMIEDIKSDIHGDYEKLLVELCSH